VTKDNKSFVHFCRHGIAHVFATFPFVDIPGDHGIDIGPGQEIDL
jgi:hypothetical protein